MEGLSCSCDYENDDPGAWWYYMPFDFTEFKQFRAKRCVSCNSLVKYGDTCLRFHRERNPYTELERDISGDQITIPPKYMCEECGEIAMNLSDLDYCFNLGVHMGDLLEEYQEMTGFKKSD